MYNNSSPIANYEQEYCVYSIQWFKEAMTVYLY